MQSLVVEFVPVLWQDLGWLCWWLSSDFKCDYFLLCDCCHWPCQPGIARRCGGLCRLHGSCLWSIYMDGVTTAVAVEGVVTSMTVGVVEALIYFSCRGGMSDAIDTFIAVATKQSCYQHILKQAGSLPVVLIWLLLAGTALMGACCVVATSL